MKKIFYFTALINFCIAQAQIVDIPDTNFKRALLNYSPRIDTNYDNEIQISEAESVITLLSLNWKNINDLTGIEAFTNLSKISVQSNPITSVDISANSLLTFFDAINCPLTSINVSSNTLLEFLRFSNGTVKDLDISNNIALTTLVCRNNNISSIDVNNHPLLTTLDLRENNLDTIDVSNNPLLTYLRCDSNNISVLDTSNNSLLTDLNFGNNPITEIDLSNNNLLQEIGCYETLIFELDLSNMENLQWINCYTNPNLTYINIRNGNNDNYFVGEGPFKELPNLETVCVDDINSNFSNTINQTGHSVTFTENCTLSIKENKILDFSVYPTPTTDILNIKSKTEINRIQIYNRLGQKIKETAENQIDISSLTHGLYFLKVKDINGNFRVKKIVKK